MFIAYLGHCSICELVAAHEVRQHSAFKSLRVWDRGILCSGAQVGGALSRLVYLVGPVLSNMFGLPDWPCQYSALTPVRCKWLSNLRIR